MNNLKYNWEPGRHSPWVASPTIRIEGATLISIVGNKRMTGIIGFHRVELTKKSSIITKEQVKKPIQIDL